MKGYQVWCSDTHLEDEFDPDEHMITKHYPVSAVYLNKEEFDKEFKKYQSHDMSMGGFNYSHYDYYMEIVEIK